MGYNERRCVDFAPFSLEERAGGSADIFFHGRKDG